MKNKVVIAIALALALVGCNKSSESAGSIEEVKLETLPSQTAEVIESKISESKSQVNYDDLTKEANPGTGNLFEEEVDTSVDNDEPIYETPPSTTFEQDTNVINDIRELSSTQEHPYRDIEPVDYGWVDWKDLPDLHVYEKDAYGNYIIPLEAFTSDEYTEYLPDYDGRIPYICCYPTNDLSVAETTIVNPIPDYLTEYVDRFIYIDVQLKTKGLYQKSNTGGED